MDFRNLLGKLNQLNEGVEVVAEKITSKTDMGDVIKDFQKSDAPQFKGKSKDKRREMAIAAKLSTESVEEADLRRLSGLPEASIQEGSVDKNTVLKLLKNFDQKANDDYRAYGDVNPETVIRHLEQGDVEAAIEAVAYEYSGDDGEEPRRGFDDSLEDLRDEFKHMLGMDESVSLGEDPYSQMPADMKEKIIDMYAKMLGGDRKKAEMLLQKVLSPEGQAAVKKKYNVGMGEGVVSDMRLSPKMQEWLKNATDEEINRMVFASGDDSLRAGAEVERLKKARAELQGKKDESVVGGNAKPADPNSMYARLMGDINEIQKGAMEGNDMADFIADELGDYLRNGDAQAGSVYEKAISIVMDALHDGADAQAEAAEQAGDFLNSELNKEDFDRDAFRESFMRMVEAKGKKPNDGNLANNAKPYDKVTRADVIAGATGNDEMGGKKKKKKADESVKEGKSKHPKGSKKYKDQMAAKHASMNESFEKFINNEKLSFEEAVKIVRESGGQQKIDPVDTALWNWAQRVAANKFTESRKAEMYAGLIYERNGGEFQIHDVLSED